MRNVSKNKIRDSPAKRKIPNFATVTVAPDNLSHVP